MTLPVGLAAVLEARLGRIAAARPVGGGSINRALRLDTAAGPVFLKYCAAAPPGTFRAEADGLRALAEAGAPVPRVLAVGDAPGYLALEWLEEGPPAFGALGRALAQLHRPAAGGWGWESDNFIGSLPQANRPTGSWAEFWSSRRLEPQLRRSVEAGRRPGTAAEWDRLLGGLAAGLAPGEREGPSLLHGDLWSGNVVAGRGGPVLVDPAVYRGHREVDLAMAELFGGFPDEFFAAYGEVRPLEAGYAEHRRMVYQLYPLLVHVNLFGGAYVDRTARLLRRCLAA